MKFLKPMLLALLASAAVAAAAAGREHKVVYHVTDATRATAALNNIRNHVKADPDARIVVVTNGAGIDFLLEGAANPNGNPYDAAVQELTMHHKVEFRVCNNTLEARHIDKGRVIPEAKIVPSGVAEAARLQLDEGYAYLKP
jgi:intracellular sulfur oxidation DsrE/DsrF family protein